MRPCRVHPHSGDRGGSSGPHICSSQAGALSLDHAGHMRPHRLLATPTHIHGAWVTGTWTTWATWAVPAHMRPLAAELCGQQHPREGLSAQLEQLPLLLCCPCPAGGRGPHVWLLPLPPCSALPLCTPGPRPPRRRAWQSCSMTPRCASSGNPCLLASSGTPRPLASSGNPRLLA